MDDEPSIDESNKGATRYYQYQLPGGENYRELLFTIPAKKPESINFYNWLVKNGKYVSDEAMNKEWHEQGRLYRQWSKENGPDAQEDYHNNTYNSVHWREPNVLAHVRYNARRGTDGEKVLHVEEVQSDWHQEGRRKGYKDQHKILPEGYAAKQEPGSSNSWAVFDTSNVVVYSSQGRTKEEAIQNALRTLNANGIPDAPFKTTWPEFVMKRMIRYAAENGYDRISWTTGEQQAERYDLSKQVDKVIWTRKEGSETGNLHISKDHQKVFSKEVKANEVPDIVGKEVASKLLTGNGKDVGNGETQTSLSGLDLKVGGEGMKGFYDKIIPAFLNKYAKKWGARVEKSKIGDIDDPVFSIPITDSMKKICSL